MQLQDKIEILITNFQRKHGYPPTTVLLPEIEENKIMGLVVKQGPKLAVGLGTKLLFWDDSQNKDFKLKPVVIVKSWQEVLNDYDNDKASLSVLLSKVVEFEMEQRLAQ